MLPPSTTDAPSRLSGVFPRRPGRGPLTALRGHYVYVIRGADSEVLYVGITHYLKGRMDVHQRVADERGYARWTATLVADRAEAEALEVTLTKQHRPRYNVFVGPSHLRVRL